MIDSYTVDNQRDFNQRYVNTYGWLVKSPTEKCLVHLTELDANNVYFTRGGDMTYHAKINSGVQFEFIPVKRGWFRTITNEPVLLYRVPARQWKRGISGSNTAVLKLESWGPSFADLNFEILNSIFVPGHDPHKVINWTPMEGRCVLSKHFAQCNAMLYLHNNCVADWIDKDNILLRHNIFQQEVEDLFRRLNYKVKVNNASN